MNRYKQTVIDFVNQLILEIPDDMRKAVYWNSKFDHFARLFGHLAGRPFAFNIAIGLILLWLLSGPIFGFSDTWQLIINTATTIVTFLIVFLIQHTQNRDTEAMQVKLDELIRTIEGTNKTLLDLEEIEEEELRLLRQHYVALAKAARAAKYENKS